MLSMSNLVMTCPILSLALDQRLERRSLDPNRAADADDRELVVGDHSSNRAYAHLQSPGCVLDPEEERRLRLVGFRRHRLDLSLSGGVDGGVEVATSAAACRANR